MARDTWPAWQQEYRFGVVLIFPPEPVLSLVDGLRRRYDPRSHATCAAHVSLTVPAPRPLDAPALRELAAVVAGRPPLRIRYGPPMVYPSHPGVTLRIEPHEDLRDLVAALEAAAPFRGAQERRWPFSPHMTIAEFIDRDGSERIMDELAGADLSGELTCTALSVAVPDDTFRFAERHRLPLRGVALSAAGDPGHRAME